MRRCNISIKNKKESFSDYLKISFLWTVYFYSNTRLLYQIGAIVPVSVKLSFFVYFITYIENCSNMPYITYYFQIPMTSPQLDRTA